MHIALLGAGHIGGALALALKQGDAAIKISAFDAVPSHTEYLLDRGAIDYVSASAADAVHDADVIIFATPLRTYRALAQEIAPAIKHGAIVTDVGSVKSTMRAVQALLPAARIVPGHPIAGSEKSGPEAASADLFQNRLCILTPDEFTNDEAFQTIQSLWRTAGADVIQMPIEIHDQIYAYVSHLPHYIAFIAASYFHSIGVKLLPEDAMLQQFLRISRSNPRMWSDVALENREAIIPAITMYISVLKHFATELRAGKKTDIGDPQTVAKSLLPRVLAASLICGVLYHEKQTGMDLRPFGGAGIRDIVAPAAEAPEGDTEAISNTANTMADHLDAIIPLFRDLKQRIGAEDADGVFTGISTMVADANALISPRN